MSVTSRLMLILSTLLLFAEACTTVHLPVNDELLIGRTMELGGTKVNNMWSAVIHTRESKNRTYGFVSFDVHIDTALSLPSEGMNEVGFTVSVQTHQQAVYQSALAHPGKPHVLINELAGKLLGNCRTIEDASQYLDNVVVIGNGIPKQDRVHWSLADAEKNTLIVEYIDGELVTHENIAGVFTNDPQYMWHIDNLNLYSSIDTRWPDASEWSIDTSDSVELNQERLPIGLSHGTNLLGLPGGYTPSARFVRVFVLRQHTLAANPPKNFDDGVRIIQGLLNTVHIVLGSVPSVDGGSDKFESTEWSVLKSPTSKWLFYRNYSDLSWRKIDLNKIDFGDEKKEGTSIRIASNVIPIKDVTKDFA